MAALQEASQGELIEWVKEVSSKSCNKPERRLIGGENRLWPS